MKLLVRIVFFIITAAIMAALQTAGVYSLDSVPVAIITGLVFFGFVYLVPKGIVKFINSRAIYEPDEPSEPLPDSDSDAAQSVTKDNAAPPEPLPESDNDPPKKKKRSFSAVLIWVFLILPLALFVWFANYSSPSGSANITVAPSPSRSSTTRPTPPPLIELFPKNGEILLAPSYDCVCPFSVSTLGSDSYYVRLFYVGAPLGSSVDRERTQLTSIDDIAFFISASSGTVEIDIPIGRYELYYCSGKSWYGTTHYFGDDTKWHTSDDIFIFNASDSTYHGYSLQLYTTPGGNLDTDRIDSSDLPFQ